MSTLTVPPRLNSPRDDASQLYKAFKGFGCDTGEVINILAHRDASQREYIKQEYLNMYSEDLLKRLASELSGKLENAVLLWIQDPAARDAVVLRKALTNIDAAALTEVLCSRTPSQIQIVKQIYLQRFGSYLEHDIESHTSGDHKKLLFSWVSIQRYEGMEVDRGMAENDAKALYKAGEKRLGIGPDENVFIRIFCERSGAHLAAISSCYEGMYGHSLEKAVKKETDGLFRYALLTIVRCAESPAKYFAKVLHRSMKGLGTDDEALIRVIVTRTEIDMQYIKAEYYKKYNKSLNDAVQSETSGHYQKFLLELLGSNH